MYQHWNTMTHEWDDEVAYVDPPATYDSLGLLGWDEVGA